MRLAPQGSRFYRLGQFLGGIAQRFDHRVFKDDSGVWTFEDVTFKGEEMGDYAFAPTNKKGLKITMLKKFIKSFPRFMRLVPKIDSLPPIRTPDAQMLQQMKALYLERVHGSEKFINSFHQETFKHRFESSDMEVFVSSFFDLLTIVAEADSYYRDRIFDYHLLVFQFFIQWTFDSYMTEAAEARAIGDEAIAMEKEKAANTLIDLMRDGPVTRLVRRRTVKDLEILKYYGNYMREQEGIVGPRIKEVRTDSGRLPVVIYEGE